jgi:hypothetical protein
VAYAVSRSLAIYGRCAGIYNGVFLRPEVMDVIKFEIVESLSDIPKTDDDSSPEGSKQGTGSMMNSMQLMLELASEKEAPPYLLIPLI